MSALLTPAPSATACMLTCAAPSALTHSAAAARIRSAALPRAFGRSSVMGRARSCDADAPSSRAAVAGRGGFRVVAVARELGDERVLRRRLAVHQEHAPEPGGRAAHAA